MLRFISYMKVKLKCVLCCLLTSTSIFFFFFALVLIVSSSWISLVEELSLFLLGWFNSGFDDLCLVIGKCISCEHKKIEILLKEQIFEYTTKSDIRVRNMKAQTCYQWRNISYLIYTLTQLKIIIIKKTHFNFGKTCRCIRRPTTSMERQSGSNVLWESVIGRVPCVCCDWSSGVTHQGPSTTQRI